MSWCQAPHLRLKNIKSSNCPRGTLLLLCSALTLGVLHPSLAEAQALNSSPPAPMEPAEKSPTQATPASPKAPDSEARAAYALGDRLYFDGDYPGAIRAFEKAYALSGRIEMLFNLANAHERMGDYRRASVALRGYIPHSPQDQRPALERRLQRFEELAELPPPPIAAPLPPPKSTETTPQEPTIEQAKIPLDRAVGIAFVTLGVTGLAIGTGFAISAANARANLDELCVEGSLGRLCPSEAEQDLEQDRIHSLAADISFVAGTAIALAGTYFIVRSYNFGKIKANITATSLSLQGTF